MSDDPSRPASGPQSDPYPIANAPDWWSALGRRDLPLDSQVPAEPASPRPAPVVPTPSRRARPFRPPVRWRMVVFNVAVLVVALLIVCVGVGVVSPSMFLTMVLIFGVPLALSVVTISVIARRSR